MGLGQHTSLGEYCGPSTASEVCLIFTTQIISISVHLEYTIVKELTRRKYCYMNTHIL